MRTKKKTKGWIGHRATICGLEFNGHSCTLPPNHPPNTHAVLALDEDNNLYVLIADMIEERIQWLKVEGS